MSVKYKVEEKRSKEFRLKDRLEELSQLNENIGKLALFMNSIEDYNENDEDVKELFDQLNIMESYSKILKSRIVKGNY